MDKKYCAVIIDDEYYVRKAFQYHLEKEGFDVETAQNGYDGIKLAEELNPDVVILDWMMPEMSGLEVLVQLRKNTRIKNIPVIMLTGRNMEEDLLAALEMGANDYIPKPFAPQKLGRRVRRILEALKKETPAVK